jgi:valyl-tRNA synthetase
MSEQLSKVYEPKITERFANKIWEQGNFFHAQTAGDSKAYAIVIPPPNVTAPLHIGHALNNTLQDILIRFKRMQGYSALWMPGTDHAGIATQTVVEKQILAEEGKRRTDFSRQDFVARVQAWKDEYEAKIIEQLKAMGCSCDWDRTRFTMDAVCAKSVRAAFFNLFKDGLIYRGKRLVNWDPATQTVLADDEVEHETIKGHFWYLRYPLVEPVKIGGKTVEYVTVATTRPETMLGDTAVAMNPADRRAKYLVGKTVRLPIVGRIIPIIADERVVLPNPESEDEKARFSTGFLKVTPAHDPDDWEIGLRHNLAVINTMAPDGSISDKFGWDDCDSPEAQSLLGLDRFEAREAIVEWFRKENLLEDTRDYTHDVGHSYRSHVPVEPYLSDQWYIAVKKPIPSLVARDSCPAGSGLIEGTDVPANSLAGLALKPLLDGRLRFIPERYANTYRTWLENLRDWPISRQLWWGHRISIWTICPDYTDLSQDIEKAKKSQSEFIEKLEEAIQAFAKKSKIENDYITCRTTPGMNLYICTLTEKADKTLESLKIFLDSFELEKVEPGKKISFALPEPPGLPQCKDEAFTLGEYILTIEQDVDVLDTWFSSALWPFSTMGWPEQTAELKKFYPTDLLCTAREIITLWVSRMVMMGQYCAGDIPFSDVYIHAMIQEGEGRKMSKSLGNGIDPLTIIDSHGADAMRFTLASMTTETQDIRMPVVSMTLPDGRQANTSPKFDFGRNFCNKLWNASRFALMNLEGIDPEKFDKNKMKSDDRRILSRLANTITQTTEALEKYQFSEPLSALYKFFWNDFCDWYLEGIKPRMRDEQQRPIAQNVLAFVLDQTLRLLHPFAPFVTEGIFQKLREIAPVRKLKGITEAVSSYALVIAEWPKNLNFLIDEKVEEQKSSLSQPIVRGIRDYRKKSNIPDSIVLPTSVQTTVEYSNWIKEDSEWISYLANIKISEVGPNIKKQEKDAVIVIGDSTEAYIHNARDPQAERERLEKQKNEADNAKKSLEAKLANENFVARAKPEVVKQTKEKLSELAKQLETIEKHLRQLDKQQ